MKFIREIPIDRLTDETYNNILAMGFIVKWKGESIEVWADCTPEEAVS
jgi:hypothetical protein